MINLHDVDKRVDFQLSMRGRHDADIYAKHAVRIIAAKLPFKEISDCIRAPVKSPAAFVTISA